jgi:hypothetical protein
MPASRVVRVKTRQSRCCASRKRGMAKLWDSSWSCNHDHRKTWNNLGSSG